MKKSLLTTAFVFVFFVTQSQDFNQTQDSPLTDSLKRNLEQAKTPLQKIFWLGELSGFYMNLNTPLSDQYGNQQLEIAEQSRDRILMLKALLSNADRYFYSNGRQEYIEKAIQFGQRALDLAKSSHLDDYTAWAYLYLAKGARANGENDKALNYNTLAVSMASVLDNDSLKVMAFNSLGDTYLNREEKLLAFRNYLQGMNLAESLKNYSLTMHSCYNMSDFYAELGDYEKSKDYLFRLKNLTLKFNKPYDRLNAYQYLGYIYSRNKQYDLATRYYETVVTLSDSLKLNVYKLNAYFGILNQYLVINEGKKAFDYLREKPELKQFLLQADFDYFLHQFYASAHASTGNYDSALYYYRKAEKGFEAKVNKANVSWFYSQFAQFFKKKGDHQKSLEYWLKAKKIAEETKNIENLKDIHANLDSAYQALGDYRNAYAQKTRYYHYKDSLEKMSTEKDLLLLEVDNENKRKEKELLQAEEARRERHNIQYMGITAGIAGVFIVLVMLGAFSVSKTTIRILGFFAFIFLFEFIILLADNQIHHWTHGEPWKILAIKIGLISILLPLHHYTEERVIHYLTSRKLLTMNAKGLLQKWTQKGEAAPVDH